VWSVAAATNDASKPGEARAPLAEMEDIVVKKKKDKPAEVQSQLFDFMSDLLSFRVELTGDYVVLRCEYFLVSLK